uniref:Uncharacterized protein n=1 Tax=Anguilla anguilla TaxID=7936 RepID=A0A0E9S6H4_ANGAN
MVFIFLFFKLIFNRSLCLLFFLSL